MQILKRHNLRKYFSCHSTFGRHIHRMYCIEPSLHNSPSFVPRGSWKFCRWFHNLLHGFFHHSVVRPNCCIAVMDLAATFPEVFHQLAIAPDGIFFPLSLFSLIFWHYFAVTNYECLFHWDICAFLRNCSQEFAQNFLSIQWAIGIVKRITVKVK